jgi:hypothetical protein
MPRRSLARSIHAQAPDDRTRATYLLRLSNKQLYHAP